MEECQCSNIVIMQLFHELKQQFPALPDYIVSQCIAQNSHDREICTRSLRAAQDLRSSPGAFPPPAPEPLPLCHDVTNGNIGDTKKTKNPHYPNHPRAHRPDSLNIGKSCLSLSGVQSSKVPPPPPLRSTTSTAHSSYPSRGSSKDLPNSRVAGTISAGDIKPTTSGFEVNVNVACSPAKKPDFYTRQSPHLERSDLINESHYKDSRLASNNESELDHTRGYTSVSLILRPPSSEPQPPIDIRSQGSSLTYSTSSSDARGFQSRLLISIGPGQVGSVAAARIKSQMGHPRPNSLISAIQSTSNQSTGMPAGPSTQLGKSVAMMSSSPTRSLAIGVTIPNTFQNPSDLSTIVTSPPTTSCMAANHIGTPLNQVAEHQKQLVTEQLKRKERLAHELRIEKMRLETMKKDIQILLRPVDPAMPAQALKKKLRSEIYQLQIECDRLADEVDRKSDPRVPFGETNEEFYQSIYTGQSLNIPQFPTRPRPPLPSMPPAWEPRGSRSNPSNHDREDRDGPSWVCRMCTFDNHPLMDKCEQCDMPKFRVHDTGTTSALSAIARTESQSTSEHNSID